MATAASRTTNPLLLGADHRGRRVRGRRPGAAMRPGAPGSAATWSPALVVIADARRVPHGARRAVRRARALPAPRAARCRSAAAGIRIGGPVSLEGVLAAFYDGLRLATLLLCIGAANVLANPKRLLKSMPSALHEIGVADHGRSHRRAAARRERAARAPGPPAARRQPGAACTSPTGRRPGDDRRARSVDPPRRGDGRPRLRPHRRRRPRRVRLLTGALAARRAVRRVRRRPTGCSTRPRRAPRRADARRRRRGRRGRVRARRPAACARLGTAPTPGALAEWCVAASGSPSPRRLFVAGHVDPEQPEPVAAAAAVADTAGAAAARDPDRASLPAWIAPPVHGCPRRSPTRPVPASTAGRRVGVIRFEHVSFTYAGRDQPVLARRRPRRSTRVSCAWSSGATGSGKSTLLGAINGLVPHFTGGHLVGRVVVDGRDTRDAQAPRLADVVG